MKEIFIEKFKSYYWPYIKMFIGVILIPLAALVISDIRDGNYDRLTDFEMIGSIIMIGVGIGTIVGAFVHLIYDVIVPWRNKAIFKKSILKNIKLPGFNIDGDSLDGMYRDFKFLISANAGSAKGEIISIYCFIDVKRSEFNDLLKINSNYTFEDNNGYYWLQNDLALSFFKEISPTRIETEMNYMIDFLKDNKIDSLID